MIGIYRQLVGIACTLGVVEQSHLYKDGYITIEGKSYEGNPFALTLNIKKEEENNGN